MQLTDEQQQIRDVARAFAQREIAPFAVAIQQSGTDQQKRDYLTKLTSGEWLGSILLAAARQPCQTQPVARIRTRRPSSDT